MILVDYAEEGTTLGSAGNAEDMMDPRTTWDMATKGGNVVGSTGLIVGCAECKDNLRCRSWRERGVKGFTGDVGGVGVVGRVRFLARTGYLGTDDIARENGQLQVGLSR